MATVLITGANRGIGLELSRQLTERGDHVIALCRKASPELEALGVRLFEGVDVTDRAALDRHDLTVLAEAAALRGLAGHRHRLVDAQVASTAALTSSTQAFPGATILFVCIENPFDNVGDFRPARRIIRKVGRNQLVEGWLGAGIRMFATHPDGDLGRIGAIDLHRRAGRIAGATAHTFLLVDFERRLAVDHGGTDGGNRTARDDGGPLADVRHEIVIDLRRLGVLDVDRDIPLTAAVDLAAGGRDVHAVRHLRVFELVDELVHHRLHDARRVGARDVPMPFSPPMEDFVLPSVTDVLEAVHAVTYR